VFLRGKETLQESFKRRKTDKRAYGKRKLKARTAGATLLVSQEVVRLIGRPLVENNMGEIAMEVRRAD